MTTPYLSVVVPAYNCALQLDRALAAIMASELPRADWELIVADDGSKDATPEVAARCADRVVQVADGPRGPGHARNLGASVARGELLVFVDADVCVSPTAIAQFAALFLADPTLGAAFGAYDTAPEAPGLVSQYRNLLHHYIHSANAGPAVTFWAGCGAVRRTAFDAVGGFDVKRYVRPQIEDIELGYRLAAAGYPILLRPEIQGTHLKRWTLRGGFVTDVRDRGIPWMRLLLERREIAAAGSLNLRRREKAFTLLVPLTSALLLAAVVQQSMMLLLAAAFAILVVIAGNWALLAWFARMRGLWFALGIIPLRLAYYLLNAVSAGWVLIGRSPRRAAAPLSRDTFQNAGTPT